MAVVEKTVDLIGDAAMCDILISREVPEGYPTDIYDDTVKYLKMNALYGTKGLHLVHLAALNSIGTESITHCPDLVKVEAPLAGSIASSGIRDNPLLEEVDAPLVTSISSYAFSSDSKLKKAVFPKAVVLDQGAFYGCGAVIQAEFPRVETIGNYAIGSFVLLEQLDLPSVKTIGYDLVYADSHVTVVNIGPNITSINASAFRKTSEDLVINLAVAEGVVSGAPWGATGATINYNVPYSGTVPMPED